MGKWLLLLLAALGVFFVLSGTGLVASVRDTPNRVEALVRQSRHPVEQSRAQLSQFEFNRVAAGVTKDGLRGLIGEPASRQSVDVEGIVVDCWYYGVAAASGAYQFCFQDGRLRTKTRYAVAPPRAS